MDKIQPKFTIGLVGAWFAASYTCLLFAVSLSIYLQLPKVITPTTQKFNLFAALPKENTEVSEEINSQDGRAKVIENLFKKNNSPLASYSQTFINVADKYKLDFRLLPSIAMQESQGGQKIIKDSYNPFGYGIYGKKVIRFSSWEEAIENVGKALKLEYIDQGLKTPTQIMAKYTPPALRSGGGWAKGVSHFMELLQ